MTTLPLPQSLTLGRYIPGKKRQHSLGSQIPELFVLYWPHIGLPNNTQDYIKTVIFFSPLLYVKVIFRKNISQVVHKRGFINAQNKLFIIQILDA